MSVGPDPDVDARKTNAGDESTTADLCTVVVSYEGRADRRTVYPQAADDFDLMTHWFTADDDAFRNLDECR